MTDTDAIPESAQLWRYMSFSKLISVFSEQALYFSRCDGFLDPFEGALGSVNDRDSVMGVWDEIGKAFGRGIAAGPSDAPKGPNELGDHTYPITIDDDLTARMLASAGGDPQELGRRFANQISNRMRRDASNSFKKEYESTFICCWHYADHESEAMWRLYSKDNAEGVAFQTTAGELQDAVKLSKEFHIRRVQYQDDYVYDYSHTLFSRFVTKRLAFEHEREVRSIIVDEAAGALQKSGIYVPVNVEKLMQRIVVSAYAPSWMTRTLADVVRRFNIPIEVTLSKLQSNALRY